MEVAIKYN